MRTIKFKGKRVDNGEWVEGDVITNPKDRVISCVIPFLGSPREFVNVMPETVSQFIGLTDKNGKEIFDGDIFTDSLGNKAIVEWDEKNARYLGFSVENRYLMYIGREPKVTVIGNIHDNPELLK